MSKNISSLSGRDGKELDDPLWERLQKAASADGTPEDRALTQIADDLLIGEAITYGTSSFYDFLKKENQGKKAYVCYGSACLVAGTQDKVHHELAKRFKPEEIGHMCCLGRCHENSAFNLGGLNYSGDAIDRLAEVVDAGLGVERLKVGGASSFPDLELHGDDGHARAGHGVHVIHAGDAHAVSASHNLLSAFVDNHLFHGNTLKVVPNGLDGLARLG